MVRLVRYDAVTLSLDFCALHFILTIIVTDNRAEFDACANANTVCVAVWPHVIQPRKKLSWLDILADLVLDPAAAGQLVAIADGDDDGRLEEKGIPPLQREKQKNIHY